MTAVLIAGAGILLLEVGIWYAANPVFTNERRYASLRSELDRFIECVRELNKSAADGSEGRFRSIKAAMHESVEAMVGMTHVHDGGHPDSQPTAGPEAAVEEPVGSSAD